MKILVLSDTHSQPLPKPVQEELRAVDMVVHVGDFCDMEVLIRLQKEKQVKAVYGNMDSQELHQVLPGRLVFKCEEVTIGLTHGEGAPGQVIQKVQDIFRKEKPDVIIFGHSHMPINEVIDGILFFNPGSPTDTVRAPYRSYGILEVKGKTVHSQIVKLK